MPFSFHHSKLVPLTYFVPMLPIYFNVFQYFAAFTGKYSEAAIGGAYKAVLKIFVIFTEKHLCWSLFLNKVADFQACNFIKKRLQHSCFPVNIARFLSTPILKNIL